MCLTVYLLPELTCLIPCFLYLQAGRQETSLPGKNTGASSAHTYQLLSAVRPITDVCWSILVIAILFTQIRPLTAPVMSAGVVYSHYVAAVTGYDTARINTIQTKDRKLPTGRLCTVETHAADFGAAGLPVRLPRDSRIRR